MQRPPLQLGRVTGVIPHRPDDALAIGIIYSRISEQASGSDQDAGVAVIGTRDLLSVTAGRLDRLRLCPQRPAHRQNSDRIRPGDLRVHGGRRTEPADRRGHQRRSRQQKLVSQAGDGVLQDHRKDGDRGLRLNARKLSSDELQEQEQHITEIEKRIGSYPEEMLEEAATSTPPTPPAEPSV